MRNKWTSLCAAVAAFAWLSLPTEAADFAKKQAAPKTRLMKGISKSKEAVTTVARLQQPADKRVAADKAKAANPLRPNNVRHAENNSQNSFKPYRFHAPKAPMKLRKVSGETVDEHGLIVAPAEGARKVYYRGGRSYVNSEGFSQTNQDGTIQLVWCEDGTVYIRNILYSYPTSSWVKGTRQGNTLSVPIRQPVYYNPVADVTYSIGWGMSDGWGGYSNYDAYADTFDFEIDDEQQTVSLKNSSEEVFMGLFWDDDNAFAWAGDFETVWNYWKDFEPMPTVEVSAPAGLQTETWYVKAHETDNENTLLVKRTVTVGFDGNAVYLKGLFADFPEAGMKGSISDGTVTFDGLQLQGQKDGKAAYAAGMAAGDLQPFSMAWDETLRQLSSLCALVATTSPTDIECNTWFSDITVQADDPFAPISQLPWANGMNTDEEFEWFTVIDANNDGLTWHRYENQASYKYSSDNQADDWLLTPAFRLEAGKYYSLSFVASASSFSYAEQFEVKMGTSPTAEAMTADVIPLTSTDNELGDTVQNKLITVSQSGVYYFGIHVVSPADQASLRIDNVVVDETVIDAPAAVADLKAVADEEKPAAHITFTAPTTTIAGDALTDITKAELLRNDQLIATLTDLAPGQAVTYTDEDETLQPGNYYYQVRCHNSKGKGDITKPVKVTLIQVLQIPYYADFSNDEDYDQCSVIDANEDYFTFEWGGSRAEYNYCTDNQADDYLVSPPLHLEGGKNYAITVNAGSAGYPEVFDIVAGQTATAQGLSTVLLAGCTVELEDEKDFEATLTAQTTGTYYVAVHCVSPADQYQLWVNKMSVEVGPAATAPAAPVLAVTPAAKGEKKAIVRIDMPQQAINGTSLEGNLKVELYRDGTLVKTEENVTPGQTLSLTDEVDNNGFFTYQAIPYNQDGKGQKSPKQTLYIGIDAPLTVANVKAEDLLEKVRISWDKVGEEGRNGGYVNPADITYNIYACEPGTTYVFDSEPVATVKDAASCDIDFDPNEGEQTFQAWVVTAENEAGASYMDDAVASIVVGKPYDLPLVEGFANGRIHYYWDTNALSLTYGISSDDDGTAIALTTQNLPGDIFFSSGKLNVNAAKNPVLLLDAAGFGVTSISVLGNTNGSSEAVELAQAAVGHEGYREVKVPLSSLKNADGYAQIAITATIENATIFDDWGDIETQGDALILDNIRIVDLCQNDLAVAVSALPTVSAGKTATVTATVTNWGEQPASNFTVTVKDGDKVLMEQTVGEELAPFKTMQIVAELPTSVFDEDGDRTVTAEIGYTADENPDNNQAETIITVVSSNAAAPTDLAAQDKGADGVQLSWTAPELSATEYTETFDNTDAFPTFSIGGITATEHTGTIGEWTVYDATGAETYSWQDASVSYDNRYQPQAWMPFDFPKAGFSGMTSLSGTQAMLSMCIVPGEISATDHWLISPELPGMEQEISFYALPITNDYGDETFEVLASSTDKQPESFELVESLSAGETSWTQFNVTLPEGTRYFAIRHTSNDIFGLFVDDITFNYIGSLNHYNVYYDGTLVATVEEGKTTFTLAAEQLTEGQHTFGVTAVYNSGQESKPATATIDVSTGIEGIVAQGKKVDVYSVDGRMVRQQATSLDGLKGIYVINGKTVLLK